MKNNSLLKVVSPMVKNMFSLANYPFLMTMLLKNMFKEIDIYDMTDMSISDICLIVGICSSFSLMIL